MIWELGGHMQLFFCRWISCVQTISLTLERQIIPILAFTLGRLLATSFFRRLLEDFGCIRHQ